MCALVGSFILVFSFRLWKQKKFVIKILYPVVAVTESFNSGIQLSTAQV